MASIRKRGGKWHVQVRRKGRQSVTRSFLLKADAEAWGRQQDLDIDRQGLPTAHKNLKALTVADLLTRYRDEVVPRKRGADRETLTINAFLRKPIARIAVSDLTTGAVSVYCSERLRRIKPTTMNRELDVLRHAFFVARKSWDIPITDNVFASVTRPKQAPPRERRLGPGERQRLREACLQCRNPFIGYLVELAISRTSGGSAQPN